MTISNQDNRTSAVADNTIGQEIPYLFPTLVSGDLDVYKVLTSTGEPTALTEGADDGFTATYSSSGGTVTITGAIAVTFTIHIIRNLDRTQSLDLTQGGPWNAENAEAAWDKTTKLVIQNKDAIDRCIKGQVTDTASDFQLPTEENRASTFLTFDSNGKVTTTTEKTTGTATISPFGETLIDDADSDAAITTLNLDNTAAAAKGDAYIGVLRTETDAEAQTLHTYIQNQPIWVTDFGAVGDGSDDDTVAIQAALDAADGRIVSFPANMTFKVTSVITLPDDVQIEGNGSTIKIVAASLGRALQRTDTAKTEYTVVTQTAHDNDVVLSEAPADLSVGDTIILEADDLATRWPVSMSVVTNIVGSTVTIVPEPEMTLTTNVTMTKMAFNGNLSIRNLKFDCTEWGGTTEGGVIGIWDYENVDIHNVQFDAMVIGGTSPNAILVFYGRNVNVSDVRCDGANLGSTIINVWKSGNVSIRDCSLDGDFFGMATVNCDHVTVHGNTIVGRKRSGGDSVRGIKPIGCFDFSISDNHFQEMDSAIKIEDSGTGTITGNICRNCGQSINYSNKIGDATIHKRVTIIGNVVTGGNATADINAQSTGTADLVVVANNIIEDGADRAIVAGAVRVIIEGNIIRNWGQTDTDAYAIVTGTDAGYATIANNILHHDTTTSNGISCEQDSEFTLGVRNNLGNLDSIYQTDVQYFSTLPGSTEKTVELGNGLYLKFFRKALTTSMANYSFATAFPNGILGAFVGIDNSDNDITTNIIYDLSGSSKSLIRAGAENINTIGDFLILGF